MLLKAPGEGFYQTCWTQKYPHNLTAKEEFPVDYHLFYSFLACLLMKKLFKFKCVAFKVEPEEKQKVTPN